jgi:biotin carboxyl carrier protein
MKIMNKIESDISGKVVEILVNDGDGVEFGQSLVVIE